MAEAKTEAEEMCPLSRRTDASQDYNYQNKMIFARCEYCFFYIVLSLLAPSPCEYAWIYTVYVCVISTKVPDNTFCTLF